MTDYSLSSGRKVKGGDVWADNSKMEERGSALLA